MPPLPGAGPEVRVRESGSRRAPSVFFGDANVDEEANQPQSARGGNGGVISRSDAAASTAPTQSLQGLLDAADAVTSFQAPSPARGGRPGTVRPAPSVNNFFAEEEGTAPILADKADDEGAGAPGISADLHSPPGRHAAGRSNKVAPSDSFTSVSVTPGLTAPQRPPLKRKRERRVGRGLHSFPFPLILS